MQNDIEIYLRDTSDADICQWLRGVFGTVPTAQSTDHNATSHNARRYRIAAGQVVIPLLLVKQGDWTSVWFDSAFTPWANDLECARDAVVKLGQTARCTDGGWQEGDDPDRFLEVTEDGVSAVIWRDE